MNFLHNCDFYLQGLPLKCWERSLGESQQVQNDSLSHFRSSWCAVERSVYLFLWSMLSVQEQLILILKILLKLTLQFITTPHQAPQTTLLNQLHQPSLLVPPFTSLPTHLPSYSFSSMWQKLGIVSSIQKWFLWQNFRAVSLQLTTCRYSSWMFLFFSAQVKIYCSSLDASPLLLNSSTTPRVMMQMAVWLLDKYWVQSEASRSLKLSVNSNTTAPTMTFTSSFFLLSSSSPPSPTTSSRTISARMHQASPLNILQQKSLLQLSGNHYLCRLCSYLISSCPQLRNEIGYYFVGSSFDFKSS